MFDFFSSLYYPSLPEGFHTFTQNGEWLQGENFIQADADELHDNEIAVPSLHKGSSCIALT